MYIKRQVGDGVDLSDDVKAKADIGYVHAVHHVAVEPIGSGGLCTLYLIGKMQKSQASRDGAVFMEWVILLTSFLYQAFL